MVRRAVLLGAGHAHLFTLKRTAAFVRRGFELVLVAPEIFWYSGLATGVLAGIYPPALDQIDVGALVVKGGGRFIRARATAVDVAARTVSLDTGSSLSYDVLSCNLGSEVPLDAAKRCQEPKTLGLLPFISKAQKKQGPPLSCPPPSQPGVGGQWNHNGRPCVEAFRRPRRGRRVAWSRLALTTLSTPAAPPRQAMPHLVEGDAHVDVLLLADVIPEPSRNLMALRQVRSRAWRQARSGQQRKPGRVGSVRFPPGGAAPCADCGTGSRE